MASLNTKNTRTKNTARSPIATVTSTPNARTALGAAGFSRDAKSELYLLAASNFYGDDEFHELGADRVARFKALVAQVATEDPLWLTGFLPWLRRGLNIRTAAVVAGVEAARALLKAGQSGHLVGPARQVLRSCLTRADEPAEAFAYWLSTYGRKVPKPILRAIGDAATRLYTERNFIKHNKPEAAVKMRDVVELTHPKPTFGTNQSALFRYMVDQRRDPKTPIPESLAMLRLRREFLDLDPSERMKLLCRSDASQQLNDAGLTWEQVSSGGAFTAATWEALIPTMGLFALVRNLRNFDKAGVSDKAAEYVARQLNDPEVVRKSMMFPFRFLAAYRAVSSLRWAYPLEQALTHSLANVPALSGSTLILVDQSPSMFPHYLHMHSQKVQERVRKSGIGLMDQAKLFGTAIALRCDRATLVQYGDGSKVVNVPRGSSVLSLLDQFHEIGGTDTFGALGRHYAGHNRVIVLTDEQTKPGRNPVPDSVPMYTWNLGGYGVGHGPSGSDQRHTLGGLTDGAFRMIPLLEAGSSAGWPWERLPEPVSSGDDD